MAELQAVDYGGKVIPEEVFDPRAPVGNLGGVHKISPNYMVAMGVAIKRYLKMEIQRWKMSLQSMSSPNRGCGVPIG